MNMKRLKIIVMVPLMAVAITSCKKNLDIQPTDSIIASTAFTTVNNLEQGLLGVYASWSGENTMYVNALLTDEAKISNENRGQGQFEFKYQFTAGGATADAYGSFYKMIDNANRVLAAFNQVTASTPADETRKSLIKAELLALRGWAHFELLQRYAPAYDPNALGVPYVTTSELFALPSRNKVSEVLAGIDKDLSDGKNGPLPVAATNNQRLNKAVIAGMQARVALYRKDWAAAQTFATECITTSAKPLATRTEFPLIWTDESEAEVLLKLRRVGTGVGTLWRDTNGDVFFEPSDKLKSQFNRTTDIRFTSYFLIGNTGGDTALIKKFFSSPRGPYIVDVKLMRTAEMHLIRAEARAESDDLSGAAADINLLRAARITGYTPTVFSSKADAITEILNERYKELAYEGFRFFDLKRRNLPVNRLASDVQSTQWQNLEANSFRFSLPIPQTEIFANPNVQQNPGY
jgi:hypothetical protein